MSDPVFRYDTSGTWYKGNTHIHSTASDGGMAFPQLAELYASGGYDFLFRTDHWVASDARADGDDGPLLWLDGIELDGRDELGSYYHAVCLGKVAGLNREMGFVPALIAAREQGALTVLAHPQWCGNSTEEALRHPFDGVEVYNHVCRWLNGKSDGAAHRDAMLARNPETLVFAVDDSHLRPEHPGWNGGWIRVNAPRRGPEELLDAIRRGNFIASRGPEIRSLECEDGMVRVRTSPAQFVRLVGPAWQGLRRGTFDGEPVTEAEFEVPEEWADRAFIEVEDEAGRRAWTNTLFVSNA